MSLNEKIIDKYLENSSKALIDDEKFEIPAFTIKLMRKKGVEHNGISSMVGEELLTVWCATWYARKGYPDTGNHNRHNLVCL